MKAFSKTELAAKLHAHRSSIWRWLLQGAPPPDRRGRYDLTAWTEWLQYRRLGHGDGEMTVGDFAELLRDTEGDAAAEKYLATMTKFFRDDLPVFLARSNTEQSPAVARCQRHAGNQPAPTKDKSNDDQNP